jgi:hypothetical protein
MFEQFVYIDTTSCVVSGMLLVKVKVKQSRYRPGVAQRVPGSEGSQIT